MEENLRPQMTIGGLIRALRAAECDTDATLQWDFLTMGVYPGGSYRGFYDQYALEYGPLNPSDPREQKQRLATPADLARHLEGAIGQWYTGWKGGEYMMLDETPVWVGNPGESHDMGVVGVRVVAPYLVVLETRFVDSSESHYWTERIVRVVAR